MYAVTLIINLFLWFKQIYLKSNVIVILEYKYKSTKFYDRVQTEGIQHIRINNSLHVMTFVRSLFLLSLHLLYSC